MSTNLALAQVLREIADLLDLQGERFKPEAYRRAARSIESLAEDIRKVAERGELSTIPGVGDAISEKIREYLRSGSISYHERLRRELPPGIVEIMNLPGLGPKTARRFLVELNVEGPAELEEAIQAGRLAGLKGFGPRKIELIREALAGRGTPGQRTPILTAWRTAEGIIRSLRLGKAVERAEAAGSLRRRRESVGDLDILVTSSDPERVFDEFSKLAGVRQVKLRGGTKETILWEGGLQVDLRVVEPGEFGAALQYFTGSKDHNIHLRSIARDRGLKINEYGVFRGEERLGGATEEEVYATLGLPWIPAEIREEHGEIEAAMAGSLPSLVQASDVRGSLHHHVRPDEPKSSLRRVYEKAVERKFDYVGFTVSTDAGKKAPSAPPTALLSELQELGRRGPAEGPRPLLGIELELPSPSARSPLGKGWDYWVGRPTEEQVAHPESIRAGSSTGEPPLLIAHVGGSDPVPAADRQAAWVKLAGSIGTALELSVVDGLDSTGAHRAHETGVPLHISPAGSADDPFDDLVLAIGLARRGWVGPSNVLNARSLSNLKLGDGSPHPVRRT